MHIHHAHQAHGRQTALQSNSTCFICRGWPPCLRLLVFSLLIINLLQIVDSELACRRFLNTTTRYNALPQEEREQLDRIMVRRRLNAGDVGWLAPLVRTCPVTGLRGLHSPFWASRPGVRPPVEVDGMSESESRAFLDRLEAHVLKPEFRRVEQQPLNYGLLIDKWHAGTSCW